MDHGHADASFLICFTAEGTEPGEAIPRPLSSPLHSLNGGDIILLQNFLPEQMNGKQVTMVFH